MYTGGSNGTPIYYCIFEKPIFDLQLNFYISSADFCVSIPFLFFSRMLDYGRLNPLKSLYGYPFKRGVILLPRTSGTPVYFLNMSTHNSVDGVIARRNRFFLLHKPRNSYFVLISCRANKYFLLNDIILHTYKLLARYLINVEKILQCTDCLFGKLDWPEIIYQ